MHRVIRRATVLLAASAPLWLAPPTARAQSSDSVGILTAATMPSRTAWRDEKLLRICGDPDNLPFSNERREGFENRIAEVLAHEIGDSVAYLWWPHRRGFVRNTLGTAECDVILGVPRGFDPVGVTSPYYRSTYYIVQRADRPAVTSLDDPALKTMRIGVNLIGYDYTNTPPAHALGRRGIVPPQVVGFETFYDDENRPGDIVDAVVSGRVDVAFVWGPLAGYYVGHAAVPLRMTPLPDVDPLQPELPFAYDIAVGVRHSDKELRAALDGALQRRHADIERILREYNVPTRDQKCLAAACP